MVAQGKLALLKVYSSPLSVAEAHCLFVSGDVLLMGVGEGGKTHGGGSIGNFFEEKDIFLNTFKQGFLFDRWWWRRPQKRAWGW